MQALLKTQAYNVLFNEDIVALHFPNVHAFYLVAGSTTWICMWAYMESRRLYKEAKDRKQTVRTTSFHLVDGANHFVSIVTPRSPRVRLPESLIIAAL